MGSNSSNKQIACAHLDVFLIRHLGVPGQEELAFGAIASGGVRVRVLDFKILRSLPISSREIESITERARQELRVAKPPIAPTNHHSLLSERSQFSSTMALQPAQAFWQEFVRLRQLRPEKIVVAVPVAPTPVYDQLAYEVDEMVSLRRNNRSVRVGQFYDFSPVEDMEVANSLAGSQASVVTR